MTLPGPDRARRTSTSARTPLPAARHASRSPASTYLVATLDTGRFPTGTLADLAAVPGAGRRARAARPARRCGPTCSARSPSASTARRSSARAITVARDGDRRRRRARGRDLAAGDVAAVRARGAAAPARRARVAAADPRRQPRGRRRRHARAARRAGHRSPVTDAAGRDVGTVLVSIQSVSGLYAVTSYLTQAFVLVRDGAHQLVGQRRGPATLPASGPLSYDGAHFSVFSFAAHAVPGRRADHLPARARLMRRRHAGRATARGDLTAARGRGAIAVIVALLALGVARRRRHRRRRRRRRSCARDGAAVRRRDRRRHARGALRRRAATARRGARRPDRQPRPPQHRLRPRPRRARSRAATPPRARRAGAGAAVQPRAHRARCGCCARRRACSPTSAGASC